MKYIITIIIISSLLVGCTQYKSGIDIDDVQEAVNNVEMLMNIRYTGYSSNVESKIDKACSVEVAKSIKDTLDEMYSDKGLIDITDFVMGQTNTYGLGLSDCVIDADGKYYIDTSKVKFNYPDLNEIELQVYDGIYKLSKDDIKSSLWEYKGNKNYNLEVVDYELYDDGYMEVVLGSSKEENVVSNEQTVGLIIGDDGKVESIDISDIISRLKYD